MNLVKLITPLNLAQEREKFLADDNYHPVFSYNWQKADNKPGLVAAILAQDIDAIHKYASLKFELTNWDYLPAARRLTMQTPEPLPKESVQDFVDQFGSAFAELGLAGYSVEVVDAEGFNFRPAPRERKIYMSKHADFQFFDAAGEVRHELTHIIRYENGRYNQIKKSPHYLPTEEGLATLMQDTGKHGKTSEFQHAAEYIASSIGLKGSLRDIYDYFLSIGFNKELAWQRASRHKFGFVNTKEPGDILKPTMYFANSLKIKQISDEQKLRLFVGKIALAEISNYPEYRGLIDVSKLVEFYQLNI
jgi:hypothetical protein